MAPSKPEPAFYVGRKSFHMQITKPPTPAIQPQQAPARPNLATPPSSHLTPRPILTTPVSSARSQRNTGELVRGLTMEKSTFAGFCLTAFACGIVSTVALDRVLPRGGDEEPIRAETAPAPNAAVPQPRKPPEIAELPAKAAAPESEVTTRAPTAIPSPSPANDAVRPSLAQPRKRPASVRAPTGEESTLLPPDDAPGKTGSKTANGTGITIAKKKWADPFE